MKKKLAKKASVKVWTVASKFQPNLSKNTSYDEAWEIIANEGDLEGEIETSRFNQTKFILYRGEEQLKVYELGNIFKDGDYDWTAIYKTVCEDVVARRLYKKPKLSKKAQKAKDEEIAKQIQIRKEKEQKEEAERLKEEAKTESYEHTPITELRRLRDNLKMRIWDWKKKNKDITPLEIELAPIEQEIQARKNAKKPNLSSQISKIDTKVNKVSQKEKSPLKSKKNH